MKKNLINRRSEGIWWGLCVTLSKRILSTFLCITFLTANFITASLPVTDISVYAADSKAIVLVNDGVAGNIANPTSGAGNWSSVYFGNYYQDTDTTTKNPVEWNVLSNANKKLFLLADQNLDCRRYNEQDTSITWENCTLRKWLNGEANGTYADNNFIENAFSDEEQSAIATTAVVNDKNPDYNTPGGKNTSDKVFLLSIDEAINPSYGFPDNYIITDYRKAFSTQHAMYNGAYVSSTNGTSDWWLRSPGISDSKAAFVDDRGYVNTDGNYVSYNNVAVRPAFNINLESVILTSAAVDGKDAGATLGSLKKIASYSGTEWKLTILDSGRNAFTASAGTGATLTETKGYTSWTVPVTCTGATSGTDEHISVILTDSDGKALYYGHIQDSVTIPTGLEADTYTLNVFNEQCNGNYKTDLSSPISTINLTVTEAPTEKVATPTFSPAAGTYTEAQNVAISCDTEGATIHYTTDGTTPTATSPTYDGAINVSETTTIKAIAVKDGMTDSAVASATYTISETPVETCTITFEPNGGKGEMDPQVADKGETVKLKANDFTRSGYEFKNWNTKADGSGDKYDNKESIKLEKDLTLYAQWKEKHEDDDDDDDSHEESGLSTPSQPSWTLEMATATIAAQKAADQQQAVAQLKDASAKLTALASMTSAQKATYSKTGLDLEMTKVSIIDANTAKLLVANNKIPYNVKIMFGQSEITITIPAGFNFKPFIKADGTINIHEVLWSIISGKTNKR